MINSDLTYVSEKIKIQIKRYINKKIDSLKDHNVENNFINSLFKSFNFTFINELVFFKYKSIIF